MFNEVDQIKLSLPLVSSIMNNGGYKALLNYLSLQSYKRIVRDEYVDFNMFNKYAFIKDENTWIHFMDKLVDLKLAVKNGKKYTTKTKLNAWKKLINNDSKLKTCLKFNGFLHFDMTELYLQRENRFIKDVIYLSIIKTGIMSQSVSRKFVQELTGVSKNTQRQIEKRNCEDVEVIEHHIPVDASETNGNNMKHVGDIPVFQGAYYPKENLCIKTNKKGAKNCDVIQLGNRLNINIEPICSFEKAQRQFVKTQKSNLDQLNKSSLEKDEVDWDDITVIDESEDADRTLKHKGMLSNQDMRYRTWKNFKSMDYSDTVCISGQGDVKGFRESLNTSKIL